MNKLHIFKNDAFEVRATLEDGTVLFDAETVAVSLGITDAKNGRTYVRWARVNEYLGENSPDVAKGDMIPEPMVYKLAFKASNETAEKFQDWLAIEVIPQIRKTGNYSIELTNLPPELQLMNALVQQMNNHALSQLRLETALKDTKQEIQDMRDAIVINPKAEWRKEVDSILRKIGFKADDYSAVRREAYQALQDRARCKPNVLVTNLRKRAAANGMQKSKVDNINLMDVLENDVRLREIFISIVKEMRIKWGV